MNFFCPFVCFFIALLIGSYPITAFSWEKEGTIDELTPMVVTAKGGFPEPLQSTAWSITTLKSDSIKGNARSLPEALFGIPSIMVQKLHMANPHLISGD